MKRVQIFLSVNAAKWLIAEAISRRPEVQTALENGTLILKGGTTTSCLSATVIFERDQISSEDPEFARMLVHYDNIAKAARSLL